ncbi:MAG: hypothetical protein Q4E87_02485 [bacterium]|nr:hypothetical protein [bacterium]
MSINFTSNINDFASTQSRATRVKNFTEFTSKKKLEDAAVLTPAQLEEVKKIKGTFTFALHNDGRYMVVTLYHANAEKKYQFIILDLETSQVAECDSVKNAKAAVMELVSAAATAPQEEAEEAHSEEEQNTEEATKSKKSKRSAK